MMIPSQQSYAKISSIDSHPANVISHQQVIVDNGRPSALGGASTSKANICIRWTGQKLLRKAMRPAFRA